MKTPQDYEREMYCDCSTPTCSAFELRGTNIHDAKTKKLICTIWLERKTSEKRMEGESWLVMRERTEPEREAIQRHTEERAAAVCAFLNSQKTHELPAHLSPEAHALFRAYQEVWNIEEAIRRRMGEPYWQVARAGIYSLLEAIVSMDDPEIGKKLKATTRP